LSAGLKLPRLDFDPRRAKDCCVLDSGSKLSSSLSKPLAGPSRDPRRAASDLDRAAIAAAKASEILGTPDVLIFADRDARRVAAELAEIRELRAQRSGGKLFKRKGSPFWQFRILVSERWIDESSGIRFKEKAAAQRLLDHKVYLASAGQLPGTATFDQAVELLLDNARVRGLKSVGRMGRATSALLSRLSGMRAKDVDYPALMKFAAQRQEECAPDTVRFELDVARRALQLARAAGWITSLPLFPRIEHLHIRTGFFDAVQYEQVRAHLSADFRDAADFAFLSGWRQMEVLTLKWATNIDLREKVVRLDEGSTKTGAGRVFPFADYRQLAEVIARRAAIADKLRDEAIISPWVFCFATPHEVRGRLYRKPGAPLFKSGEATGLLTALAKEWASACARSGLPGRMFHDLRRSAARNFERSAIPRSVAKKLGGWSDKIYSRYTIGDHSELSAATGRIAEHMTLSGWHSGGTAPKSSTKSRKLMAEVGGSRTLQRAQCPPGRF
jgi:integrase